MKVQKDTRCQLPYQMAVGGCHVYHNVQNVLYIALVFVMCMVFASYIVLLRCVLVLLWIMSVYLGGSVGVDGDHVFNSLFDFELDVELSLQGSDAFLVG